MGAGNYDIPRSPVEVNAQERNALPQYGFGSEVSFDPLVDSNPFLFRLHTPKEPSPFYDATEPYFVAQAFADDVSESAFRSTKISPYRPPASYSYADVSRHMDWTTRSSSPFVTASFSFAWAVYEATRRYHHGMKHSIEIAVIDAKALSGRAVTAAELLRKATPEERHKDHWKWYRYALEAQDVLIWGYVPGSAVLASIPLTQILPRLPSYFLAPDPSHIKETPISRVGWAYDQKKYTYRTFCQDMSEHFLRLPVDRRIRDTSAGAVRLAIAFLRPWFHKMATDDFTTATATACVLAQMVSRWPGLWWAREHPETVDLIRCLVHIVGEEAREARRTQALADAGRMQDIVGGLETLARSFTPSRPRHRSISSFSIPSVSSTASVADEDETLFDRDFVLKAGRAASERYRMSIASLKPRVFSPPPPPDVPEASSSKLLPSERAKEKAPAPAEPIVKTPSASSVLLEQASSRLTSAVSSLFHSASSATAPATTSATAPRQGDEPTLDYYARTASALLTGFFLGTFLTLCVLSPHRREIANHWT
ncbi:uncharacterized protein BXZ73DRAFT_48704 [Epithele typhae]|uniref:uncharacterized protein n=1 Tax=Epithele typhae TaxID=378194 RepID=UPI002007ADAF|nr:uncharacterized protein BXZ73DRAFT_48704 [Epithele typhae]KAH9927999.1 hypothetical protein BXZ73DRAFT_48704 [Epithele typhae]